MAPTAIEQGVALRSHLRGMWASVADGWAANSDYIETKGAPVTAAMLTTVSVGDRVLELACGAGGLGLAAARVVGTSGHVVLSDVVPEMTAIASARAAQAGLTQVSAIDLDLEQIDQSSASYDVVLCREGLMFVPDPAAAVAEIRRVLRPGGKVAIAAWGPAERNPWLALVFRAVAEHTGTPMPPPHVPSVFSLSDPGLLRDLLEAKFSDVRVDEVPVPTGAGSFDEYWTRTTALAGPLARILGAMDADAVALIRGRLERLVEPYRTDEGLDIPGVAIVAIAQANPTVPRVRRRDVTAS